MEEKMFTGKPDLSKTHRIYGKYVYCHPGKWIKSVADGKEMWNCCSSEIKETQVFI